MEYVTRYLHMIIFGNMKIFTDIWLIRLSFQKSDVYMQFYDYEYFHYFKHDLKKLLNLFHIEIFILQIFKNLMSLRS